MDRIKINDIILPYQKGISLEKTVMMEDRLIKAIILMVNHNLTSIAVTQHNKPIGMIRLEDALNKLGIRIAPFQNI